MFFRDNNSLELILYSMVKYKHHYFHNLISSPLSPYQYPLGTTVHRSQNRVICFGIMSASHLYNIRVDNDK